MKCQSCIHKSICIDGMNFKMLEEHEECVEFKNQNKFIELPCKVGDTVYVLLQRNTTTEIVKGTVKNVRRYSDDTWWLEFSDLWIDKMFDDFGKTVFLTKEEAEQALKGGAEKCKLFLT